MVLKSIVRRPEKNLFSTKNDPHSADFRHLEMLSSHTERKGLFQTSETWGMDGFVDSILSPKTGF
jgi:hypothetical protein